MAGSRLDSKPAAAVALRIAGATYQEIADTLEFIDAPAARRAVEEVLAHQAADADPAKRELLRAESATRIDRLLRSVWSKATSPGDLEHLPAVRVALSLIDRRIRLYGLDAPAEVLVHTPTMVEIDAWVAAVTGRDAPKVIEGRVIYDGTEADAVATG